MIKLRIWMVLLISSMLPCKEKKWWGRPRQWSKGGERKISELEPCFLKEEQPLLKKIWICCSSSGPAVVFWWLLACFHYCICGHSAFCVLSVVCLSLSLWVFFLSLFVLKQIMVMLTADVVIFSSRFFSLEWFWLEISRLVNRGRLRCDERWAKQPITASKAKQKWITRLFLVGM